MYLKTIICLANSRKMSGRCVAGKVHEQGEPADWLRPVSSSEHQEISEQHRRYENGKRARLLDIVSIPLKDHTPRTYQQENYLIDDGYYWVRQGRANRANLEGLVDNDVQTLWVNGNSSYSGENDRLTLTEANALSNSLILVWVPSVRLRSSAEGAAFGNNKRKVRAFFEWKGIDYAIAVTDPVIEERILAEPNGSHTLEDAFMCVSLGEPFGEEVYKLVAAIITPDRLRP